MLHVHRPLQPLASYINLLWHHEGEARTTANAERVLPNGCFQVVIDVERGLGSVVGLRSQSVLVRPSELHVVVGVLFRPGGARKFFSQSANQFYNRVVPLDCVWGSLFSFLRDHLAESLTAAERFAVVERTLLAVLRRSDARRGAYPNVDYALSQFRLNPAVRTIEIVSQDMGWSHRWLRQMFNETVGMTPKRYCRLQRFRAVVRQVAAGGNVNWAQVASASGYFDQAHLTHEFREFTGMTPGQYLSSERPSENHVRVR